MQRSGFLDQLAALREDVLEMASRVEEDLGKAVESLRGGDRILARWVRDDDRTVNYMQVSIQDRASRLVATQQPVARDLRELISVIRMADNLERMGDYAVHLAKTVLKISGPGWDRQFGILCEMGETGCVMLRKMITAWLAMDVDAAEVCAAMDSQIDVLHDTLVSGTVADLARDRGAVTEGIKLIRTAGFLERFGDQVTNSCELVVYTVTGQYRDLNE